LRTGLDAATEAKLLALLDWAKADGRVCPSPDSWNGLWEMLPGRARTGGGWNPPLPLILAAWSVAADGEKAARLALHIRWAADHGVLGDVDVFLRGLPEDQWRRTGCR